MEFNIKYSFKVLSNYNGIMTVAIYMCHLVMTRG